MKDEIIINQLVEYIKEERYNQAVMIDGDWGSGKTYFVKEKLLKNLKMKYQKRKFIIYHYMVLLLPMRLLTKYTQLCLGRLLRVSWEKKRV